LNKGSKGRNKFEDIFTYGIPRIILKLFKKMWPVFKNFCMNFSQATFFAIDIPCPMAAKLNQRPQFNNVW
jgi:hypothetical protein